MELDRGAERRKRRVRSMAAWTAAAAGTAVLCYALLAPSDKGIPGWQPVNGPLKATLAAADSGGGRVASTAPGATARPPAGAVSAPEAAASAKPEQATPAAQTAPQESPTPALLDLNGATEAELDGLPGIGPAKAKAILDYRNAHGGFRSVEELQQVKGIGPKLLERIRPLVQAGAPAGKP